MRDVLTSAAGLAGALLGLVLAIVALPVLAQAAIIDGFVEGTINSVNEGANRMTVNGIVIRVPLGTPIASATRGDLTLADLGAAPAFPGRSRNGFLGGTCLCVVTVDTDTGVHTAVEIEVEPAENVLITTTRSTTCSSVNCDQPGESLLIGSGTGIQLKRSTDDRLLGGFLSNRGFPLNASLNNLAGVMTSVEGYMGNDDTMYYVDADFDGGTLRNPGIREVSIERTTTQCRQRNGRAEYELRGFTHDPPTGTVSLFNITNPNVPPVLIGNATATVDVAPFGEWRFRGTRAGACALRVRAQFGAATTDATLAIRVR